MTPLQIIEARAPQYIGDARLPDYIAMATAMTGTEYGTCYNNAIALRVLHMLTKDSIAGGNSGNTGVQNSGVLTGEKEGDLSRRYSVMQSDSNSKHGDLSTTGYGQELIALMDSCLFLPRNRIV